MAECPVLDSWEEVEELERECISKREVDGKWVFRGQADFCWGLKPSLLRLLEEVGIKNADDPKDVARALDAEQAGVRVFQMARPDGADPREWIYWWALAQHYGGVTREVDWSGRLGVAVYFAAKHECHLSKDGAVFALNLEAIPRDSGVDNLARTEEGYRKQHQAFRSGDPLTIHWCRAETRHLRLRVQDGWFTTCTNVLKDQEVVIRQKFKCAMRKYRIPSVAKPHLLKEAVLRGFSGAVLFCDSSERSGYAQKEQTIVQATRMESSACDPTRNRSQPG